ncbi:hypothetical protein LTS07_004587 [Exophiala sideris]|uniref:Uncharacterized protein n=1 Tax=Exophiala sideris TaxID=1016849 RepID=A0ABR0JCW0_9EURO|nr:hypothetical protein LTS07_004587 [Exophiala sideris]KAK5040895.1 hypothetical protein LTR13_003196 [Exophiala sideris]KAK5061771.1 hypothetical protein LTR69_004954 [Exophiala sideris]KAK5184471.1 hypothetical protein LTR44_003145 [Eurotiomycetes sp. CCFEE 6388]
MAQDAFSVTAPSRAYTLNEELAHVREVNSREVKRLKDSSEEYQKTRNYHSLTNLSEQDFVFKSSSGRLYKA